MASVYVKKGLDYTCYITYTQSIPKRTSSTCPVTIEECIGAGILADYLKKKGSEVINMLVAEYDYDMDIEVQREEAYTEGLNQGRIEGLSQGKAEGRNDKLIELLKKKLSKGKSPEEIADELEESLETIQELITGLKESENI